MWKSMLRMLGFTKRPPQYFNRTGGIYPLKYPVVHFNNMFLFVYVNG
jgi:hypothetical protein